MCLAVDEMMKDAAKEATAKATEKANLKAIKNLMKSTKWTSEQAMKAIGIAVKDRAKYAAML